MERSVNNGYDDLRPRQSAHYLSVVEQENSTGAFRCQAMRPHSRIQLLFGSIRAIAAARAASGKKSIGRAAIHRMGQIAQGQFGPSQYLAKIMKITAMT